MQINLIVFTMDVEKWYFTPEELENTPSRKCGVNAEKELGYRQQSAKLIQDMGQKLVVSQLAINTAIVYMHRFYMYHTFSRFHRHAIAPAALFLAAKVEEQPRKLEHVIKVASCFITHDHHPLHTQSETYVEKAQELVMNENILLQTLGFDVAIDHPHTYVVKCFQMVRALTNLPQTSYFMATNSLHMTTMCLQYKPAVVACVCIDIVCKWSNYEIQRYTEGKDWFVLVDPTVTTELLEKLSAEFIAVLDKFPNRLKKFRSMNSVQNVNSNADYRRHSNAMASSNRPSTSSARNHEINKDASTSKAQHASSSQSKTVLSHKEYTEKRDKERRERERHAAQVSSSHPVSSTSQRAHIDQLRMPPPQAVPVGRVPTAHSKETYQRKEQAPSDRHDRVGETPDGAKSQDNIIENHFTKNLDKPSENHDISKVSKESKHPPMKPKIDKVEMKPIKQEINESKPSPFNLVNPRLPSKDTKPIIDGSLDVPIVPPSASTLLIIKKDLVPACVSEKSKVKSINTNIPIPLYHPRLDGKQKLPKAASSLSPSTNLPNSDKYVSNDDVTSISSISKLISQSVTKAKKVEHDPGATVISSTSNISKKHKSEHSHKHDKDRKKKKHKNKDKKDKHKDRNNKEHKKSKKMKKHKDKDKEREKDVKHVKSIFDDDEEDSISNTPIKLTIIREKGVYTPEASQISNKTIIPMIETPVSNSITSVSSAGIGGLKITIPKSRLQSNTPQLSPPRTISTKHSNYTPNVKLKISKEKLKYDKESRKRERSPTGSLPANKYVRNSSGINLQKVGIQSNLPVSQNTIYKPTTHNQYKGGYNRLPHQQPYHETRPSLVKQNYQPYTSQYSAPPPGIILQNRYPIQQRVLSTDPYMYYPQMGVPMPMQPTPITNFNVPPPGYMPTGSMIHPRQENPPLPAGPPPQAPPPPPE